VKDGDKITLDVANAKLDLHVSDEELADRAVGFEPPAPRYTRGALAKYRKLVGSASKGAVVG
jgi:dihydroxy-acid dehydratase